MNKKIVVFFILISFLIAGGIFLSFKEFNFLKENPFLASITDLKSPSVSSESDLLPPLKEKIVFLEKKLDEKESELEYLDDLAERVDFLNQRVIELEAQFKEVQASIVLAEAERETQNDEEDEGDEEDEENKEDELVEQIPCQVIAGSSSQGDKIIINEVAWMGTTTSSSDEWIELKNISGSS